MYRSKCFFAISVLLLGMSNLKAQDQDADFDCPIDLTKPGQMSDIISNALNRKFNRDETAVRTFLQDARNRYSTGEELAVAAAEQFSLDRKTMFAAIEEFRHCNCNHPGGEKHSKENNQLSLNPFAQNVITHVVLHEMGHGVVREFDLPILGNEETLADAFATHFAVTRFPDNAIGMLTSRIESLMLEATETPQIDWTVKGEHNSDARRAYQIAALAIAYDDKYLSLGKLVNMSDSDVSKAKDYGSEIHRSWRRTLQPLQMPTGQESTETLIIVEKESRFSEAISGSKMLREIESAIKSLDWHSQIKVRFAAGNGGAAWSRSKRTITINDEYINRFIKQGNTKYTDSIKDQSPD